MVEASVYIRLSKQAGESNLSLEGMRAEATSYAETLGYTVTSTHIDDGKSGAIRDRPEFLAWLAEDVECLVTYHADRLTREGVNAAAMILDRVEGKDPTTGAVVREPVRLVSVDGLDSRDADAFRWRFVIAAEVARAERARIQARAQATRRRLDAAGRHASGPPPYGTRVVVRDGGKYLERDDTEAGVLVEVAARLLRGDSVRSAVAWMNDEGHRTRRGNPWTRSSLTTTLESAATRAHVFTLAESRALAERLHPNPGARPTGGRPVAWLLSGYATCAGCGRPMTTSRDARRDVTRYVCPTTTSSAPCPARATIRADRVDEWLEAAFLERHGATHHMELVVTIEGADLDEAERAAEAAQEALLAAPGPDTLAAYQQAQEDLARASSAPVRKVRQIQVGDTYSEIWERSATPERARLVQGATHSIEVRRGVRGAAFDPSRIAIDWVM